MHLTPEPCPSLARQEAPMSGAAGSGRAGPIDVDAGDSDAEYENGVFLTGYERIKATLAGRARRQSASIAMSDNDEMDEGEEEAEDLEFIDDRAEDDLSVDGAEDGDEERE